tara:strand:+ start:1911 stop:3581 length:1671 start_codon:yes stop_codon:yes gene_type:complete
MKKKFLNIEETFSLAVENHKKNDFKSAEKFYNEVLKKDSNHFKSIFYLASLSAQTKKYNTAKKLFEKIIYIKPNYDVAHANLGAVLKELGKFRESVDACKKAILIKPNNSVAYSNLGAALKELSKFKESKDACKKAISLEPKNLSAYLNLGLVLEELGEIKEAINCYQKLSKIKSNSVNAYQNLGKLNVMLGEKEEAIKYYKLAIKYDPENLSHHYALSDLDRSSLDENLNKRIKELKSKGNLKKQNLSYSNFLLSKYALNSKNYEKEFNYLLKGHSNYLMSEKAEYRKDVEYWLNILPKNDELNNLNSQNKKTEINKDIFAPIFIIGVPRCGSTMIEKIIASGPQNIPIGEETGIISSFVKQKIIQQKAIYTKTNDMREDLIERYKEKKIIQQNNNYIFTDKTLDNFFYIRLIKDIFPLSKIINCKRDPLSSIMSILKNNLPNVPWAHDLDHIFRYFDIYYELINNYNRIFPNFIYELSLEKLSFEPENESKKLMKFCGLPWGENCLKFYNRKDLISKTTSNLQIRRAIYRHTPDKYLPYKKLLNKFGSKYSWFN